MKPARVLSLIVGALLALLGFGLIAGGAGLGWALVTQRDDAGFFTTSTERFQTSTYAITTDEIDLGRPGREWWAERDLATVQVRVDNASERPVFVGIAAADDVEAYLANVPHDELTNVDFGPFDATYSPQNVAGTAVPAAPATSTIWRASISGSGRRDLTWDVEPGRWEIVVMNADASRTVAADIELGAKVQYLVPVAIGLAAGGLLVLAAGAALVLAAVVRRERETPAPATPGAAYPLRIEGRLDPQLSRWKWLVKWFLAIPHYIVLAVLWVAFTVLTVVAWFAIAFTGRYPRRIFEFNVGVLRWTWRVVFYATGVLGTDRYPPFTLAATDYPATLDVAYPAHLSRGLVLVKSWLLALPHLIIVGLLTASWAGGGGDGRGFSPGGGLVGLLTLVAGVVLLVRGRYHKGIFDLLMGVHRWMYRVLVYVALMTDQYPPFRLDQGGTEPGGGPPLPPPPPPSGATTPDRALVDH